MKIRSVAPDERNEAVNLIWDTFSEFEAPDYSEQGVETFRAFISDNHIFDTIEFFGAFEKRQLVGVIAARNNRQHICCFFVSAKHQRQGIGRKLWEYLKIHSGAPTFTVNSSPFAVPVYHRLGFENTDTEQITDGMRYTPMRFVRNTAESIQKQNDDFTIINSLLL